jgi:hypothetical protein
VAQQGHYEGQTSSPGHSFESIALPAAKKKNIAVIAMKVTGRNQLFGGEPNVAEGRDMIRYALSLPISHAVVGMSKMEHVRQNAELARTFQSMPGEEMKSFSERMAVTHKAALDRYFLNHHDA